MMKKSVLFTDVYHHLWKLPGGDTETGKGKRIRINFYTHNTSLFSFRSHVNKLQKSRTGCLRVEPRISAMENPDILQQNWSYTGKDSCLQLSWLPELWACCPCLGQPRTPRLLVFVIGYEGYLESLGKRGSMRYFRSDHLVGMSGGGLSKVNWFWETQPSACDTILLAGDEGWTWAV